ncbi:MAG: hypothetical protein RLZZ60_79 [Bacteroidota bacterium]
MSLEMAKEFSFTNMNKRLFGLLCIVLTFNLNAQNKVNYSIGVGFPNLPKTFFNYLSRETNFKAKGIGPFHLKVEKNIKPWLGAGISLNYAQYDITYDRQMQDTNTGAIIMNQISLVNSNLAVNARVNLHFIQAKDNQPHELYWGLGMGYKFGHLKFTARYSAFLPSLKLPSISRLAIESTLGYRYHFNEKSAIYAELGFAKSLLQLGYNWRF